MKPAGGTVCQFVDPITIKPPMLLDLADTETWKEYEWPKLNETKLAIGLKVKIERGLVFPTPSGNTVGTYEVPIGVTAWGWHAEKTTWENLMELGGFLPKFSHVTFIPPADVVTLSSIIFLEIFATEAQAKQAFPDNVREYPLKESILDELNLAPSITIHSCTSERTITLYEDGTAFVEITVANSVPFNQVQAALEPGKQAARDLAEARARRKLANTVTLTVANTTCPSECDMPLGVPGVVASILTHDRSESARTDGANMFVDWYSRHVAKVSLKLTCHRIG